MGAGQEQIRAGIVGVTGYVGGELARILGGHGQVRLVALSSRSHAGSTMERLFPGLHSYASPAFPVVEDLSPSQLADRCDVVFTAVPHGAAAPIAREVASAGKRLIDLGADFRLRDARTYGAWYGVEHGAPELLAEACYGLPELYRERLPAARVVACPGCYPTSVILALAPLLRRGLVQGSSVIVDSASGVSGAGRSASADLQFCEVNENFKAYKVAGQHRHIPEMEQVLSDVAGCAVNVTFTPHLLPITRGILSTIYVSPAVPRGRALDHDDLERAVGEAYEQDYGSEPFVRLLGDALPETKAVSGTNMCHIAWRLDRRVGRLILFSAIDNLVKGAAGQAVQCMNVAFGISETTGLDRRLPSMWP